MSIGSNIKKWREIRNLKQSDLAELIGVSDKTVSSWEINRTEPKMGMVEKICAALNCKKTDIICDDGIFSDSQDRYYINDDAREMAQFMFEHPEYKVLFDASRKVSKKDIDVVKTLVDKFRSED